MRCATIRRAALAASSAAGLTPLSGPGLASQPTLSRFAALMAEPSNLKVLREAVLELAGRGIRAERRGKRLPCVTLDVDSAPVEVHGHQPKAEWNGHYNARIYHPLIISIAETGDMPDARLRAGNVGTAPSRQIASQSPAGQWTARSMSSSTLWTARQRACATSRWCASMRVFLRPRFWPDLRRAVVASSLAAAGQRRARPVQPAPCMKRPPGLRPAEPRVWLYELRC
jgi:hypothetical protein